jgi:hypothetical protein
VDVEISLCTEFRVPWDFAYHPQFTHEKSLDT